MMDQKQVENVDYFNYWGSMTSDRGGTREIKSRIARGKVACNKNSIFFTCQLDVNLRKKLVKCYIRNIALYGAETRTLQKICRKNLGSFEMCWRRTEKISWTNRVRNEEVLHMVNDERHVLHTIKKRNGNSFGHILCKNCLLKHIVEGKREERIEVQGRRGGRNKQVLDELKETRRYWKLKEEALALTRWRTRVGRDYGLRT